MRAEGAPKADTNSMKILGFLLLITGWLLVISALAILAQETARGAFVIAGLGVEITGLVLVIRAHPKARGAED